MTPEDVIRVAVVTVAGVPIEERAERAASARIDLLPLGDHLAVRWPDRAPAVVSVRAVAELVADTTVAVLDAADTPKH